MKTLRLICLAGLLFIATDIVSAQSTFSTNAIELGMVMPSDEFSNEESDIDFARLDNTPDILDKMPDAPLPMFERGQHPQERTPSQHKAQPAKPHAHLRTQYRW